MHQTDTTGKKALVALITGLCVIGSSAVLIKSAHAPGIVTAFYRMAIGSIGLIIPFAYARFKSRQQLSMKGVVFAITGGVLFGIDMSFWATGIVASNATLPTLATNLAPIWTGLGAMLFFKEKINRGFWIGILIAAAGLLVMVLQDFKKSNGVLQGVSQGVLAGFFYGLYYLATQKGRALLTTIEFLFISTLTSAILLMIVTVTMGYHFSGYDHYTNTIFIAYGIVVQIGGWWLINFAQGHLRAVIVAPTLLGQPIVTGLIALVAIGERLTLFQLAGGTILIAGIYVVHFTRMRANKPLQPPIFESSVEKKPGQ